ncbi:DUF4304 domain-containing protein [Paenibacillus glycanilyticus]|uniref:DUF4304 domain-containing protein n=1 Tax=Paenibacillus glycanilyticus TaxID=126569 RepID=UPI003EB96B95
MNAKAHLMRLLIQLTEVRKTIPKEMFKKMVTEIAPLFKERGFKKKNATFVKESREIVQIVHFAPSSWNLPDYYSFTLDIAIFSKPYFIILNRNQPNNWFSYQSYRPIIAGDLRHLLENGFRHPDYNIIESTDIYSMAQNIIDNLVTLVFPYLDNLNNSDDVINEIEKQIVVEEGPRVSQFDLIPLYCTIGNKYKSQEALIIAWNIKIDNPNYYEMLKEFAQTLGLKLPV